MAILDARRTYVTTFAPDSEVLWVRVPHAFVESHFAAPAQVTIDGSKGAGRILFGAVNFALMEAKRLNVYQSQRVADGLLAMIAAVGLGRDDCLTEPSTPTSALRRVKAFLLENLSDDSLSADAVAAANGLTVRYINKLFEREGASLMRWLWRQRLHAARAALARGDHEPHAIRSVAFAYGLKSDVALQPRVSPLLRLPATRTSWRNGRSKTSESVRPLARRQAASAPHGRARRPTMAP